MSNKNVFPRSEEHMDELLNQMEKMIDSKISNLKLATPFVFSIVTAVITYFLFLEVDLSETNTIKFYMLVIGLLLIAFILLILSYWGKSSYKCRVKPSRLPFEPSDLKSYDKISDVEFIDCLQKYANSTMTDMELLRIKMLKQKTNEFVYRKRLVNIALGILIVGAIILCIACFIFSLGIITFNFENQI